MPQVTKEPVSTAQSRGTLLLVDDNANHREIYRRRLQRRGFSVALAASADEALTAVQEAEPDCIILDIAMPGRDGLSALQELIAIHPDLPVVIHTAYPSFRDNFLSWAAEAYVEKSTDLTPLIRALNRALSKAHVA